MGFRAIQVYEGDGSDPTGKEARDLEFACLPLRVRSYLSGCNNDPEWTIKSYYARECSGVRWLELNDPDKFTLVALNMLLNITNELADQGVDSFTGNWPCISPRLLISGDDPAEAFPFPSMRIVYVKKIYLKQDRNPKPTAKLVYSLTYRR
jgi:hypothetical protein